MDTQAQGWDAEAADRAVAVLKAVADPSRYRLLWALSHGEQPVSELARMLGAHVAATSQHLARLRSAGLVTTRREGTRIYYQAAGVRPLLEAAHLAVTEGGGPGGGGPGGEESAPAPRRATTAGPALSRRPALGGTP
ncbi:MULTISPECIES: metalloregulator ArsR/SmtB family transcription factor [unclassified Streptomyces]|uniref:ArsR/SmtB family transcription factor n=1 Tax=unclassified Streptomyces TaxID=2593676 RepID=UPI0033C68D7C